MNTLTVVLYSLFAGSATLVGLLMTLFAGKFVKRYSFAIVSLAAGVLLGTAFLHIIPESQEMIGEGAFIWLLIGFGVFYVLESLIGSHCSGDRCRQGDEDCKGCEGHDHRENHVLGSVASIGLFFHSLLDGIAIAVGFEVSETLGVVTAIAVIIHELPEGIFTLSILIHSGMKKRTALWWTIVVALATPLGTVLTLLLLPDLSATVLGSLLAIAAGSFLYISAADLIPETHKKRSITTGAFVFLGLLLMFAVNNFIGHDHTNETDHDHDHENEIHEVHEDELSH